MILPLAADQRLEEFLAASAWTWIGLAVAILALAWVAYRVREWYRDDADPAASADQLLSEIQEMYDEGDLSDEEYRSIKRRVRAQENSPRNDDQQ